MQIFVCNFLEFNILSNIFSFTCEHITLSVSFMDFHLQTIVGNNNNNNKSLKIKVPPIVDILHFSFALFYKVTRSTQNGLKNELITTCKNESHPMFGMT